MKVKKFNEVAQVEASEIVAPIETPTDRYLVMPEQSLLPRERRFWNKAEDRAKAGGDDLTKEVAWRLSTEIGAATDTELQIYAILANKQQPDPSDVIKWYNRATNYVAYSRLWREIGANIILGPAEEGAPKVQLLEDWSPSEGEGPGIIVEQASTEPHCGIQVVPRLFNRLFDVEPPEHETVWLEGQDIFVQAAAPAQPGELLAEHHQKSGEAFPADKYVTIRPFLKAAVWQPHADV